MAGLAIRMWSSRTVINSRLIQRLRRTVTENLYREINGPKSNALSTSSGLFIKEIVEIQEGNKTTFEAVTKDSERKDYVVQTGNEKETCPLCRLALDLNFSDVLILSQFVRSDGCMLPRRVTGLCNEQQRKVTRLVAQAQKAGLMSNLNPATSNKDPKKRARWKKHNKYFDDYRL